MAYVKNGKKYEAEQLQSDTEVTSNGGSFTAPSGTWIVKDGDIIVECPSDVAFKEQYVPENAPKQPKKAQVEPVGNNP